MVTETHPLDGELDFKIELIEDGASTVKTKLAVAAALPPSSRDPLPMETTIPLCEDPAKPAAAPGTRHRIDDVEVHPLPPTDSAAVRNIRTFKLVLPPPATFLVATNAPPRILTDCAAVATRFVTR